MEQAILDKQLADLIQQTISRIQSSKNSEEKSELQEQNFCLDNEPPKKKSKKKNIKSSTVKPYNTTSLKVKNFLTNIANNGLKAEH